MHSIVSNSLVRLLNKNVFLSTTIDFPSFLTGNFIAQYIVFKKSSEKNDVRNYALQLSQKCDASIACSKHIVSLHHEHRIKDLFPHSSSSQAWFVLRRQNCAGVVNA
jgi:hypothetical protein